jgi:Flp pilus assembly protein TadG
VKRASPKTVERTRRKGSAIVEFCLGAGVLIATFAGTFQFGYTFLQYNKLESAVVQGAWYASMMPYDSASTTPSAGFLTSVQKMALYGSPTAGGAPPVPGLTPGNVTLTVSFANGAPSTMSVSITGYTVSSVFGSTALVDKPKATFPYHGIWSPY